jgi:hypothetical protein
MPLGTVQQGASLVISVATTFAGTYEPISDINAASRNSNRDIAQFPVFMRATAYGIPGAREISYSFSGYLSVGDSGQNMLRTAEQNNTTVFVKVLFDGTNGFIQECRVATTSWEAAPEGLQETAYELSAVGTATVIGTGPIL